MSNQSFDALKLQESLNTIIQVFTDIRLLAIRFFLVAFLTVFS